MSKKREQEISELRKLIQEAYEQNELDSVKSTRNRARSITVGTAFGGVCEVPLRSETNFLYAQIQPTEVIELIEQLDVVPVPEIEILSHVTSCVTDNGQLSVSIGGNSWDYVFDWTNGATIQTPPDFTGELYSDLATGFYSVRATSNITGCISAPVQAEILQQQILFQVFQLIQIRN